MKSYYRPDYEPHQAPYRRARRRRRAIRMTVIAGALLMAGTGIAILLSGGFSFGAGWLRERVVSLDFFRIDAVQVSGNRTLPAHLLLEAGGLQTGASLLGLDLEAARNRLKKHPWVREATLRRRLPATLLVEIEERVPLVVVRADREYLVDEEGAVVATLAAGQQPALPRIMGVETAAGALTARGKESLQNGLRLLAAIRSTGFPALEALSYFDLTDPDDAVIVPLTGRPRVHAGREGYADRLRRWKLVAPDMAQRWPELEYVDLRADGQIVGKPAAPSPGEGGPEELPAAGPDALREKTGGGDA